MDFKTDSGQSFPEWPTESWIDPAEEQSRFRRRLQKFHLGFSMLGIALVVASFSSIVGLVMILTQNRQPLGEMLGIPYFDLIEGIIITWGSLLGVFLLCGSWPDVHWQRRSGILLIMCLLDVLLWTIDRAAELGLYDGAVAHRWFRASLGYAMGWSEFALIATLGADIGTHMGDRRTVEISRSVRSLATTGAMMWFLFFSMITVWRPPIWPLQQKVIRDPLTMMLFLAFLVLWAMCFVQTALISLLASSCCGRKLAELAQAEKSADLLPSRSEEGWADLNRKSGPKDGA